MFQYFLFNRIVVCICKLFCGTSGNVEFLWYCLFHSWKRLKFGMLLAIVLLMGGVAVFFGAWGE